MSAALKPKPRRLSDAERREIKRIYEQGKASQHAIARRFGVSQHVVFKIVKGVSAALGEKK
jgi:transposase-like protein